MMFLWSFLLCSCISAKVVQLRFESAINTVPGKEWSFTTDVTHQIPTGCNLKEPCFFYLPLWDIDVAFKAPSEDPKCPIEKAFIDRYTEVYKVVANETAENGVSDAIRKRFIPSYIGFDFKKKGIIHFGSKGTCGDGLQDGFPYGTLRKKFPDSCTQLDLVVEHTFTQYDCGRSGEKPLHIEAWRIKAPVLFQGPRVALEFHVEEGFPELPEAPCGHKFSGRLKGTSVKKMKMAKGQDRCDCEEVCMETDATTWVYSGKGRKTTCECLSGVKAPKKPSYTGSLNKE